MPVLGGPAHFFMIYKDMNRQKEHRRDGKAPVELQNHRIDIQNHSKNSGPKADQNHSQHKQRPLSQLLSENSCMNHAQQKKDRGRKFMQMDACQRHHDGEDEADKQGDV